MNISHEPDVLTVSEFRTLARISKTTEQKLYNAGTGPRCLRIGRRRLIRRAAAEEWLRGREQEGQAA